MFANRFPFELEPGARPIGRFIIGQTNEANLSILFGTFLRVFVLLANGAHMPLRRLAYLSWQRVQNGH